jgi:signal transduction histidine kinase
VWLLARLAWEVITPGAGLFPLAVMITAAVGGLGPGLLAALLATFIQEYEFVEPIYAFDVTPRGLVRLAIYLATAVLISWLSASRRRAVIELAKARDTLEQRVEERTAELADANARLRQLASELSRAEAEERRKMAVTLHEEIGQLLAGIQLRLGRLLKRLPMNASGHAPGGTGPELRDALGTLRGFVVECINRTRSLTVELSPPVLYEAGLVAAVRHLAHQSRDRDGVLIEMEASPPEIDLGEERNAFVYRAVRELLNNMAKHARARRGRVELAAGPGQVRVVVEDEGVGFDPDALSTRSQDGRNCFGLFSIRERLRCYGGGLEVDAAPGRGARFTLVLPAAGGSGSEDEGGRTGGGDGDDDSNRAGG